MIDEIKTITTDYMSSAIPNALLSIGVKALEEAARLQSPSASGDPGPSSRDEYLVIQVMVCIDVLKNLK